MCFCVHRAVQGEGIVCPDVVPMCVFVFTVQGEGIVCPDVVPMSAFVFTVQGEGTETSTSGGRLHHASRHLRQH